MTINDLRTNVCESSASEAESKGESATHGEGINVSDIAVVTS
jgi:hypothetical protein